jgi:hypothetical protein
LFTNIPVKDTLESLKLHFDEATMDLFQHVLTSTYFLHKGNFYEQTVGVPMGSPLSPAVVNFFMEEFEEKALSTAPLKPKHFFRYVDDTFIVWAHGHENLDNFLAHMNNQHPNIKFTMEKEEEGCLPFLDIMIHRKENGSLGHGVFRKKTHTDLYLNADSHYHPSQKRGVLTTLLHRARSIADEENLPKELDHLQKTFQENGFSRREVNQALRKAPEELAPKRTLEEEPIAKACIPYVSTISGKLSRILGRHGIQTIHKPHKKLLHDLVKIKDPLGLKTPGVYRIPCECGETYVGETGRTVETRLKEHKRCIRLKQPEKSAIAEHSLVHAHRVDFDKTSILCRANGYWDRVVKEAVEIRLEKRKVNRDSGFHLSNTWKPVLKTIEETRSNQRKARENSVAPAPT